MRLPKDKQTRINIYFMMPFVLVGIILVMLNLYKNTQYSNFKLVVEGTPHLNYATSGSNNASFAIAPESSNSHSEIFTHLHTFWWANRSPGYVLDGNLWFHVSPTIKGRFILTSAHIDAAHVLIQIIDEQGHPVQSLMPDTWYEIQQFGKWYTVKFQWG